MLATASPMKRSPLYTGMTTLTDPRGAVMELSARSGAALMGYVPEPSRSAFPAGLRRGLLRNTMGRPLQERYLESPSPLIDAHPRNNFV